MVLDFRGREIRARTRKGREGEGESEGERNSTEPSQGKGSKRAVFFLLFFLRVLCFVPLGEFPPCSMSVETSPDPAERRV